MWMFESNVLVQHSGISDVESFMPIFNKNPSSCSIVNKWASYGVVKPKRLQHEPTQKKTS